eukprot:6480085-Amphidinium_carterae.1
MISTCSNHDLFVYDGGCSTTWGWFFAGSLETRLKSATGAVELSQPKSLFANRVPGQTRRSLSDPKHAHPPYWKAAVCMIYSLQPIN